METVVVGSGGAISLTFAQWCLIVALWFVVMGMGTILIWFLKRFIDGIDEMRRATDALSKSILLLEGRVGALEGLDQKVDTLLATRAERTERRKNRDCDLHV